MAGSANRHCRVKSVLREKLAKARLPALANHALLANIKAIRGKLCASPVPMAARLHLTGQDARHALRENLDPCHRRVLATFAPAASTSQTLHKHPAWNAPLDSNPAQTTHPAWHAPPAHSRQPRGNPPVLPAPKIKSRPPTARPASAPPAPSPTASPTAAARRARADTTSPTQTPTPASRAPATAP